MRAVIQRVRSASVRCQADDETWTETGRIGPGVCVLLGVEPEDTETEVAVLAEKLCKLRIFPGRTPVDLSITDRNGAILVVSQFTLGASLHKGNRPSFDRAAAPDLAEPLYESFLVKLGTRGLEVAAGRFGAEMQVELINDGPFTLVVHVRGGRVVDL